MKVNDESTWPTDVVAYLERHHDLFLAWETGKCCAISAQTYDPAILGLRETLNTHALRGHHCSRLTREEMDHIPANGMQLPNGNMLRERIMAAHRAGYFSASVAERLASKNNADDDNRANRIWFCFFPPYIGGEHGIGPLLGMWGGEALYRMHHRDSEIGPVLSRTGTPCLVEADIPIASLRRHSFLSMKIVRQFLKNRGLRTREPVDHEDCAISPIPAANIRRIIRYPEVAFRKLTRCDKWREPLA